ncbi:hypothetical protein [Mucilaginibacter hurinus]|nr:hypothetical protein [Mucilaginibacter hurinus]
MFKKFSPAIIAICVASVLSCKKEESLIKPEPIALETTAASCNMFDWAKD